MFIVFRWYSQYNKCRVRGSTGTRSSKRSDSFPQNRERPSQATHPAKPTQPARQPPSHQPGASQSATSQPSQPAKPAKTSQPQPASQSKRSTAFKHDMGSGVRGHACHALKNLAGLENEVGTPRQLPHVTNIVRCSYIVLSFAFVILCCLFCCCSAAA